MPVAVWSAVCKVGAAAIHEQAQAGVRFAVSGIPSVTAQLEVAELGPPSGCELLDSNGTVTVETQPEGAVG